MNFVEKCRKIGGTPKILDGTITCDVPNNKIEEVFGEDGCSKYLKSEVFTTNEKVLMCQIDRKRDLDNAYFWLLPSNIKYFGIGNFHRFSNYLDKYSKGRKMDRMFGTEVTYDEGVSGEIFEQTIRKNLNKSHLFEVSEGVKLLLAGTKTPNKNDMYHLPFKTIFLDVNFKKETLEKFHIDIGYDEIVGILVTEAKMIEYDPLKSIYTTNEYEGAKSYGRALRITTIGITKDGYMQFDVFNRNYNLEEGVTPEHIKIKKIKMTNPKARDFVHTFVLNFLNFIQNPDVTYVEKQPNAKRNIEREKEDKTPLPPRNFITLTGHVKEYAQELRDNPQKWHYGHRFYVMGHYRTLKNPRWGKNVGKRIWIDDYVKGRGVLFKKNYRVKKYPGDIDEL